MRKDTTCQCGVTPTYARGICRSCYDRQRRDDPVYMSGEKTRHALIKYDPVKRERKNLLAVIRYPISTKAKKAARRAFRQKNDLDYRLTKNIRVRIYHAIKDDTKSGSAVNDLGCSIEELKQRLESKFHPEWRWENYGKVWVIDHIKPLASFKLQDREQFLEAVNYKNLQPLSKEENGRKADKYL